MDIDGLSSPLLAPRSSLPPSSAPNPTASSNGTPRSVRRPATDALAFGNSEGQEAQGEDETGARRRRRPRNQPGGDVPMVRDAVGESVCESFETFLKT
jgi:DNA replication licensing factor MCM6